MRNDEWLTANTKRLEEAGVPSARLDCLVLIEDESGKDRAWLLAHPEYVLPVDVIDALNKKVTRRITHEPLAYIRGKTEFYGRDFYVDQHVLEPRPETETMIELLKSLELGDDPVIVDVGTGSGAIAITAMLELGLPSGHVYATDIDPNCLRAAQKNADSLGAHIECFEADLLELRGSERMMGVDAVLANLPYVPDNFQINLAAGHEPRLAIFGGPDGLDLYRRMFTQLETGFNKKMLKRRLPRYILTEALPPHHEDLAVIASRCGYQQISEQDFIQVFSCMAQ